jgi:hypothetical protein
MKRPRCAGWPIAPPGSAELPGKSTARPQRPRACDNGVVGCPVIADRNDGPG